MSLIRANGGGLGGAGAPGGALGNFYSHLLDQSIRLDEAHSPYLTRTIVSAGSRTKSTFSCWFKVSRVAGSSDWSQTFYNQGNDSGAYHYLIGMYENAIYINDYDYGSGGSPGSSIILQTNRLFRDTSAWYHLVVRIDTTQATAADRARVYVNGVDEGDTTAGGGGFSTQTINVSQSANMYVMNHTQSANGSTSLTDVKIGKYVGDYNNGYIAEINYCDGQSLGPDSFGETKDGIWIPKDTSGLTFGTNGFHLTFKDDVVSEGFNTVTYRANASTQAISGLGFQPDFVWIKDRDNETDHGLFDTVRGAGKSLKSNTTAVEQTQSDSLTEFNVDGFSLGDNTESGPDVNYNNGDAHVAWCWEAGGSTPSQTYEVTVSGDSGANKYRFDGNTTDAPTLNLQEGGTYTFDQSDNTNSGHPLRFSTTSDGTHGSGSEYTTGVSTTGTPGSAGAKTVITVAASAATLYYYCTQHSGMGGQANTNSTAGSTNLKGSILSTVSANTARGFSIVGYEATGTAGTIGHGLSAAPEFIILKHRDQAGTGWPVYFGDNTDVMYLGENYATADDANAWNDTSPTSTVFSVGPNGGDTNNSLGGSTIAYCFHSVSGYSKFGTWQNNDSTTGTQVTGLGFKPAFIIVKNTDNTERWFIQDNTRQPTNLAPPSGIFLVPDANSAEGVNGASTASIDFQDDGFQIKCTDPASGEISFGTRNYIYMAFADTREAAFFKDVTTNGNHFRPVNLDYRDSVPDVPSNNFATMNALANRSGTLSNGNLSLATTTTQNATDATFQLPSSLKWYFEFAGNSTSGAYGEVGISTAGTELWSNGAGFYGQYARFNNATIASGLSFGTTDVLQVAYDGSNRKVWLGINDTWYAADGGTDGDPSAGTNESGTLAANEWFPSMWTVSNSGVMTANFGQDSSFDGIRFTANSNADSNGKGSFAFAPPSGFLALCSQNLPDAAIIDGTENFNTVLYTGNGSTTQNVTVGFDSDFTWIKSRSSGSGHHSLVDSVRGDIALNSNQTIAEYGVGPFNFNTDGTIDVPYYANDYSMNTGSATYVAWNWLAGTAFSNSSGSNGANVNSSGQVNTTAGFSIVSWQFTNSADNLVFHGLSQAPEMMIIKSRTTAYNWDVYHTALSAASKRFILNGTSNSTGAGIELAGFFDTAPTDTLFEYNTSALTNNDNVIAYCFHSVDGYSKIGTYSGNNAADGTFVYTGFRPAWVMIKKYNAAGQWWGIYDSVRDPDNLVKQRLWANATNAESAYSTDELDFLSNGFKPRGNYDSINGSGSSYLYLAFADQPFKFANAR